MALHRHEPIHEGFMSRKNSRYTLCEVLRQTYWMTDDPQIRENLRLAVSMGKAMVKKLREYKADWDKEDFWDDTPLGNKDGA